MPSSLASNASCAPTYAGNRCARCTEGHFKLYNQCKPCGITALIWIFSVVLPIAAVVMACRLMWAAAGHETRFLATIPILQALQVVGMIANINVQFPDGVADYIHIAAIAQLDLEIMQHSCLFGSAVDAYYTKVRAFFWLPVFLVGALCLVYTATILVWRMASGSSASATDRTQRLRDQLCSVGCCVFTLLYVALQRGLFSEWLEMPHPIRRRHRLQVRADDLDELVRLQLRRACRWDEPVDAGGCVRTRARVFGVEMGARACAHVCVRACVFACLHACKDACVRVRARTRMHAR
jgi:hypothetical protein